nr:Ig-like domain-containing protein [Anaerolineae bacterium]
ANWDKVEKAANGYDETEQPYVVGSAEGGPYTVNHTVLNWRDVLVTGTNIANGATDVALDSVFTATFNKDINQSATFTVLDSTTTAVPGTFSYTANSITFTPTGGWMGSETYTVTIGSVPAAGDGGRFFSDTVSFTTADAPIINTNLLTNGGFEAGLAPWAQVNPTADRVACPTPPTKVYEGACAYRLKGSEGEFSRVQQAVTDFSGLTLDVGDEFVASGWFRTTANTRLRLRMIVFFSDGTSVARGININGAGPYREVAAPGYVLDRTDVTLVRVRLINRSAIGQTWVDNLNLSFVDNDAAPRDGATDAPLSMPDAFRGGN